MFHRLWYGHKKTLQYLYYDRYGWDYYGDWCTTCEGTKTKQKDGSWE